MRILSAIGAAQLTLTLILLGPTHLNADGGGNLNINVTTVTYGGHYSPKNIGAIWIEDAQGKFVKSVEVWAARRIQHLIKWQAASNENTVDAITSATLRQHTTHSVTWNCTNVNGTVVPDGNYTVLIEFTEDNSSKSGEPPGKWTEMEFTKSAQDETLTFPNLDFFRDQKLVFSTSGAPAPASLSGTVRDSQSNAVISGATVQLKQGNTVRMEITSDGQGVYVFNDIPAGIYVLAASNSGYTASSQQVEIASGQQITGQEILLTPVSGDAAPAPPQNVRATVGN